MPWREVSAMDERREFVRLAMMEGANRRELCRRFGISPDVGYKWLRRAAGDGDLTNRSRRPLVSPGRTAPEVEAAVLRERDDHPAWGARKIARRLADRGMSAPAVSTVHAILDRHGRIAPVQRADKADGRFERGAPNELWQMDFKGWVRLTGGQVCHPLTVIDDHSRFSPCLQACADQQGETVQARLKAVFRRYGLPQALFVDNGPPWGSSGGGERWTRFGVWLLKLDVDVMHSRPYHPQGRGKNERFHRTLKAEVLAQRPLRDLDQAQRAFDRWREVYNFERPHEALDLSPPISRYRPSARPMPETLDPVQYDHDEIVRRVWPTKACISFKGRTWRVPRAFQGEPVALRPLDRDGRYGIFFGSRRIADIDLTNPQTVSHVPEQASAMSTV